MPYTTTELHEEMINTTRIFEGKVIKVRKDEIRLPDGNTGIREVVEHQGAVAIVPVTKDGKIILVRQFRYPIGQVLLEVPAGKLDAGERPEACALRELAEETGFVANKLRKLTSAFTTPGFSNEVIHLYLAEDLVESDKQPDDDEFINTEEFTPDQIRTLIASGEICDAKTLAALYLAGF